jgi:hypothetical protein
VLFDSAYWHDSDKVGQRVAAWEMAQKYTLTDPCSSDILKRPKPWLAEANAIGTEYVPQI